MSIEGQGHFITIYFPDFVGFVLYYAKISGERLQDHWSSGFRLNTCIELSQNLLCKIYLTLQSYKNINVCSFKSSENIPMKEVGPYGTVSNIKFSSVTLKELATKAR